jgi:hypothetical protein
MEINKQEKAKEGALSKQAGSFLGTISCSHHYPLFIGAIF